MLRKLLAVVVSGAWLLTSIAASAAPPTKTAKQTPASPVQASAAPANTPPLPPGGALDIRKAQGEFSDLGFGVILLTWLAAGGLLYLIFAGEDDDGGPGAPTGTP